MPSRDDTASGRLQTEHTASGRLADKVEGFASTSARGRAVLYVSLLIGVLLFLMGTLGDASDLSGADRPDAAATLEVTKAKALALTPV